MEDKIKKGQICEASCNCIGSCKKICSDLSDPAETTNKMNLCQCKPIIFCSEENFAYSDAEFDEGTKDTKDRSQNCICICFNRCQKGRSDCCSDGENKDSGCSFKDVGICLCKRVKDVESPETGEESCRGSVKCICICICDTNSRCSNDDKTKDGNDTKCVCICEGCNNERCSGQSGGEKSADEKVHKRSCCVSRCSRGFGSSDESSVEARKTDNSCCCVCIRFCRIDCDGLCSTTKTSTEVKDSCSSGKFMYSCRCDTNESSEAAQSSDLNKSPKCICVCYCKETSCISTVKSTACTPIDPSKCIRICKRLCKNNASPKSADTEHCDGESSPKLDCLGTCNEDKCGTKCKQSDEAASSKNIRCRYCLCICFCRKNCETSSSTGKTSTVGKDSYCDSSRRCVCICLCCCKTNSRCCYSTATATCLRVDPLKCICICECLCEKNQCSSECSTREERDGVSSAKCICLCVCTEEDCGSERKSTNERMSYRCAPADACICVCFC